MSAAPATTLATIPGTSNLQDFLDSKKIAGACAQCAVQSSTGQLSIHTHTHTLSVDRLVVALRDGRKFFGVLRSYDQYGN